MITITRNQTSLVKVYLNQSKLSLEENVSLRFNSPSRPTITLDKSLTELSTGFYSLLVTSSESIPLKDDTYSYQIIQGANVLKYGFVRMIENGEVVNNIFDYTLDFILS